VTRTPEQLVRDFCAAWSRLDPEELIGYFTDDAVYHNMPGPPTTGKEAIAKSIRSFLGGWQKTTWDIDNLATKGNLVFTERVDRTDAGGKHVDLPVAGVFEVDGEKIAAWRDYFDLQTYLRAMQA
jgi:limonene-1,2-epoxide hydrolase